MRNSTVGEKAKRAMAQALLNEVFKMMERDGCDTINQADLIAHLETFKEEIPESELAQPVFADDEGAEIKSRFGDCGVIQCDDTSLSLRNVEERDREDFIRLQ